MKLLVFVCRVLTYIRFERIAHDMYIVKDTLHVMYCIRTYLYVYVYLYDIQYRDSINMIRKSSPGTREGQTILFCSTKNITNF